jgi:hypothetical protein
VPTRPSGPSQLTRPLRQHELASIMSRICGAYSMRNICAPDELAPSERVRCRTLAHFLVRQSVHPFVKRRCLPQSELTETTPTTASDHSESGIAPSFNSLCQSCARACVSLQRVLGCCRCQRRRAIAAAAADASAPPSDTDLYGPHPPAGAELEYGPDAPGAFDLGPGAAQEVDRMAVTGYLEELSHCRSVMEISLVVRHRTVL